MSEQQPQPRACGTCSGSGGKTVDSSHDGTTIQVWHSCDDCAGSGVQGGGI